MMKLFRSVFVLTLFVAQVNAQTTPLNAPGGSVTIQPGTGPANSPGTVQPQAASPMGNATPTVSALDLTPTLTISGFRRFSDPMLESFIQQGLDNSPNLRAALSRLEESRIRVRCGVRRWSRPRVYRSDARFRCPIRPIYCRAFN